ncbi:hypothetical protein PAPYR_10412 [Paratrimastix pyriformis]|uniref:Uncharacterized protein n=1 Tax=Paratrimastix pyriformis TaxID=342808 RepID=A0ABQ8UB09_9EUKA|nr:hypothetical protein PAPYR_10412 [Paratrimastix pyriformis]
MLFFDSNQAQQLNDSERDLFLEKPAKVLSPSIRRQEHSSRAPAEVPPFVVKDWKYLQKPESFDGHLEKTSPVRLGLSVQLQSRAQDLREQRTQTNQLLEQQHQTATLVRRDSTRAKLHETIARRQRIEDTLGIPQRRAHSCAPRPPQPPAAPTPILPPILPPIRARTSPGAQTASISTSPHHPGAAPGSPTTPARVSYPDLHTYLRPSALDVIAMRLGARTATCKASAPRGTTAAPFAGPAWRAEREWVRCRVPPVEEQLQVECRRERNRALAEATQTHEEAYEREMALLEMNAFDRLAKVALSACEKTPRPHIMLRGVVVPPKSASPYPLAPTPDSQQQQPPPPVEDSPPTTPEGGGKVKSRHRHHRHHRHRRSAATAEGTASGSVSRSDQPLTDAGAGGEAGGEADVLVMGSGESQDMGDGGGDVLLGYDAVSEEGFAGR